MNLILTRRIFTDKSTIGELRIEDNSFTFFTLEDVDRDISQNTPVSDILRLKALYPGQVAIPSGTYEVAITWSNRFKKLMPQLLHVPGYDGIRIHIGNTEIDTIGCILVGNTLDLINYPDSIAGSRTAFDTLFPVLQDACSKEKVFIMILKNVA